MIIKIVSVHQLIGVLRSMCVGEGVLISQSRGTQTPVTAGYDSSHAPIRALDSFATHTGHNIS